MKRRRRRSDRSGRAPLMSPGRPSVAGRDERRRFWVRFPTPARGERSSRVVFPHLEGAGGASARIFRTAAEVRAAVSEFRHTLTSAGASLGSASAGPTTTGRDTPLHQTCSWQHGDPDVRLESTDPAVPTWVMPGKRAQGRSSKAAGLRASGSARLNRARWHSRSSREHYLNCCPKPLPSVAEQFDQLVLLDQQRPCCDDHLNSAVLVEGNGLDSAICQPGGKNGKIMVDAIGFALWLERWTGKSLGTGPVGRRAIPIGTNGIQVAA